MKLWHDDIRKAPDDSWFWARTNDEAKQFLSKGECQECSLDHDLGLHDGDPDDPQAIFQIGQAEDNGMKLVMWMVQNDLVPNKVTIHSWNPDGARDMADFIKQAVDFKVISNTPEVIVQRYEYVPS